MRWGYFATVATLALANVANGAGYYNMPTSLQQCLGVGFGPGHHAPLLLGPMLKSGITAQPIRRLDAPLSPPPAYDFGGPSLWGVDAPASFAGSPYGSPAAPMSYTAPTPSFAEPYQPAAASAPMLSAPRVDKSLKGAEVIPAPRPVAD